MSTIGDERERSIKKEQNAPGQGDHFLTINSVKNELLDIKGKTVK